MSLNNTDRDVWARTQDGSRMPRGQTLRLKDRAPIVDQGYMAALRELGPKISYNGWGLVLVACDVAEAVRRRLVLSTVAIVAALAVLIVIILPAAGAGSSALAEGIVTTDSSGSKSDVQSAAKDKFLEIGGYSITLPDGWRNAPRPPGAAFSATSADGLASTTLWIKRNPKLDLDGFKQRSKRSLSKLGQDVTVLSAVEGATPEDSSVELAASVPLSNEVVPEAEQTVSTHRVTLRVSGPYRYYLATTIQPGAAEQTLTDDADDLSRSLRPWLPN